LQKSEYQNPFKHVRNWVKGEIHELHSVVEAISRTEGIDLQKSRTSKRILEDKQTMEKMSSGKFTFKGLFKGKEAGGVPTLLEGVRQAEKEVEELEQIRKFLVVYLAEICIPNFQQQKRKGYLNAMMNFCLEEIHNAHSSQDCWGEFLETVRRA